MSIGLLLADDSDVVRRAITQMLQRQPGIQVLGEATTFAQIFHMAAALKPAVVLMDLHMPDERQLSPELIKTQLQSSAKHVVAMSVWNDEESKALAVSYGALALLEKSKLAADLVPTIMTLS